MKWYESRASRKSHFVISQKSTREPFNQRTHLAKGLFEMSKSENSRRVCRFVDLKSISMTCLNFSDYFMFFDVASHQSATPSIPYHEKLADIDIEINFCLLHAHESFRNLHKVHHQCDKGFYFISRKVRRFLYGFLPTHRDDEDELFS